MADKPVFIDSDPQATLNALIEDYEARTGRTLLPSQAERLIINSFAYILSLYKEQANNAALQNLVDFADAPALDRLGDLLGVVRLEAATALTTIEFILVTGHGGVAIPAGTRVASIDGQIIFQTSEELAIIAGVDIGQVSASASEAGAGANGIIPGGLNNILDPQPFIASASNTTTTAGGADSETDDQLRERIKLAPSAFSTAGSADSYIFHAKSASLTILDVSITNPAPGMVNVYPLVEGGITTPAEIITLVEEELSAERVRPLTDTVAVLSPTITDYSIEVDITLYADATASETLAEVSANLQSFADLKGATLGNDIMLSQITAQCTGVAGVYDVSIVSPVADIIITETEAGNNTGIVVNNVGINEG